MSLPFHFLVWTLSSCPWVLCQFCKDSTLSLSKLKHELPNFLSRMQTWHIFKWQYSSGQTKLAVFPEFMSNLECLSTIFLQFPILDSKFTSISLFFFQVSSHFPGQGIPLVH